MELRISTFEGCTGINAVFLPQNNLQIIPLFCFKNSRLLQHIPIPTTVKEIKDFAFRNCERLISIDRSTKNCCYNWPSNIQGLNYIGTNHDPLCIVIGQRRIWLWFIPKLSQVIYYSDISVSGTFVIHAGERNDDRCTTNDNQ